MRYADDFLLRVHGTSDGEAEAIKQQLGDVPADELHLELSPDKTLITHGRTTPRASSATRWSSSRMIGSVTRRRQRAINGLIGLKVPADDRARAGAARYERRGKADSSHRTDE